MRNLTNKIKTKKDNGGAAGIIVAIGILAICVAILFGIFKPKMNDVTNSAMSDLETQVDKLWETETP